MSDVNSNFEALSELGAGDFAHINGSLIEHLHGTQLLLKQWGADEALCNAGLFHAAYGTAGFEGNMVALSQRKQIAEIIGEQAEEIVYLYCSCDRNFVFANVDCSRPLEFRDRFTEEIFQLTRDQASQFCELTAANELELVSTSTDFTQQYGKSLTALFVKMEPLLSAGANASVNSELASFR